MTVGTGSWDHRERAGEWIEGSEDEDVRDVLRLVVGRCSDAFHCRGLLGTWTSFELRGTKPLGL